MSDYLEMMKGVASRMNEGTPHAAALGMKTLSLDRDGAVLFAPYNEKLIGDPETGVIAGGVVTALLDQACGQAVHAAMEEFKVIATLDLRIDYMRPAEPGKDIYAKAFCYKVTRSVAFVRAVAYDADPDDPVAAAQAAFMLNSSGGRRPGANAKTRAAT
ncbi:MAG: PaaI family thioesterase [Caulobacter sp.]|nr:PaaI family thioesterase [Caulobacter sp.]